MRDLVLQNTPSTSFRSLRINEVTMVVASLGKAESHHQQKGIRAIT